MTDRAHDGTIVITHVKKKMICCLVKGNRVERIIRVKSRDPKAVPGTVLTGTVRKMIPSINAVFIDTGCGQDGFIQLRNKNDTRGLIGKGSKKDAVKCGDMMLVQVESPPARGKPMDLTRSLSLSGKYSVVRDGSPGLHLSKKIPDEWKDAISGDRELKAAASEFSVVIRTNACPDTGFSDHMKAVTLSEIRDLSGRLKTIKKTAETRVSGSILYAPPKSYTSFLYDIRDDEYSKVITDIPDVYRDLLPVLRESEMEPEFFENPKIPLSSVYDLEKNIKELLSETVYLKSGGSVVIQQTTALCAIDVNSGSKKGMGDRLESFRSVNMEAAREIARQIIARNLSGIILVDFINTGSESGNEEMLEYMRGCLSDDPEKAECVDITELGLMEIVRKKSLPPFSEQFEG
ncbi:MAG: ribonuclease E/G [Lachnospiraceae bacterium]|nr:ribonuclease E/G [Lachnospiraceae bacterium]